MHQTFDFTLIPFYDLDNELTSKWLNRLRATANNAVAREEQSQLSSVLDYYNKQSAGTSNLTPIDFDAYSSSIHTPDVVRKIQAKYNAFMETEYAVDGAVSKLGQRSEAMKSLDIAMHYNYNLWMTHYIYHLEQIETMSNIGDVTELGRQEMIEMFPQTTEYNAQ